MAGTALNYSVADVARGPVHIFLDVATPAAGAEAVIDVTNGIPSPDNTANPSAVHLGMTTGGAELLYKPTMEDSMADELTTPYRSILASEEVVISPKGVLQHAQNLALASKLMVGATLTSPTGKAKITIGGLSTVTYRTVMAIWALPEDATKYAYWLLYRSFNDAGLAFTLSRKSDASSDVAYRGFSVSSRAVGDQVCQIVVKT